MNRTNRSWVVVVVLLASCGPPTLDGTSDATFEASAQRVRESLDESARARFDSATAVVGMSGLNLGSLLLGGGPAAIAEHYINTSVWRTQLLPRYVDDEWILQELGETRPASV